ncbi:hypothetical protein Ddye_014418 [Dipteronia dyeriana]|uniref:non-specific serine/threonine protein kinase n=1 Tax=Dipteronia dyeriana TaxID=168575 RepID=A0AAD9X889_9ROSI|nr:hypothetical protein Ddye_014418 [Dipteronia dyeriana]
MKKSKHFLCALLCTLVLADFVHCRINQVLYEYYMFLALTIKSSLTLSLSLSGFISLDCGLPEDSNYDDVDTGINYISDAGFINTGESKNLSPEFSSVLSRKQLWYVRSFPENIRNCYNIKVTSGTKYLIRATFMYGNYDSQNKVPEFDVYLESNSLGTIRSYNASSVIDLEIIHVPTLDYIHICLVNINLGTPFISAIELRPLRNNTYVTQSGSLMLLARYDAGSRTNQSVRYGDDVYDRIWMPYITSTQLSTKSAIASSDDYHAAEGVMSCASTSENSSEPIFGYFETFDPTSQFYLYLYFAEIEKLQVNQSREFNIYLNDEMWFGPISPTYLNTTTVFSVAPIGKGMNYLWLNKTKNSTLPPIINAIEAYIVIELKQSQTNQSDVNTIMKIKSTYGVNKHWQGDPCAPREYSWDGLKCSYNGYDPPRIVSLNLSSSGLTGNIAPDLVNLTSIQNLDLSNNNLNGSLPEFLTKLPHLMVLNLTGNNLTGSLPDELVRRLEDSSLLISCDGNPNLRCHKKKKNKFIVPLVASAAAILFTLLIAMAICLRLKRRKEQGTKFPKLRRFFLNDSLELKSRSFTYSEILRITDNFKRVLGKGGFGTVYHGYLGDTQVAVKILSSSSTQGNKEFQAEITLLLRVHHRNLTNFVGYCNESAKKGLIYEYMANGNLQQNLSDRNASNLSWEGRLRIAMDAAQGLEYLHHGCKPPIVHRDIKPANILLNENFDAKLADFGLSKIFMESGTHMSTVVAGTPGYLDPEYYATNRLNEKSDVYSFGIVLLKIITSRPVVKIGEDENVHITQWVIDMLGNGYITNIVDRSLEGNFETNSAWKTVELALACASHVSSKRPTMNDVVMELKDCLAMETTRKKIGHDSKANSAQEIFTMSNMDSECSTPRAR